MEQKAVTEQQIYEDPGAAFDFAHDQAVAEMGGLVTTVWAPDNPMKPGDTFTVAGNPPLRGTVPFAEPMGSAPIPFRPLHNQVVIRVLREEERSGSIIIPEAHNDNKQFAAIGTVIAKGVGHRRKSRHATRGPKPERAWLGGYCPLPVEEGDQVLFARSSGEAHVFDGEMYLVTPIEHVFGVIEGFDASSRSVATEREFGIEAGMDKKWNRPASERPIVAGKHR